MVLVNQDTKEIKLFREKPSMEQWNQAKRDYVESNESLMTQKMSI